MCGIAGVVNLRISNEERRCLATEMANSIRHRGPDSSGIWSEDELSLTLAHRRLSIQDLSPNGHQPMASSCGKYVISFNGEIYNFNTLKNELMAKGHSFRGHSDTEVLVEYISYNGLIKALENCKGMFAFAVLDRNEETLHLVRDRIGEKPLYYSFSDDYLYFSSELKSIKSVYPSKFELDNSALSSFLRYGYISAPQSIYKGVYKVSPAQVISFQLGKYSIATPTETSYWSIPRPVSNSPFCPESFSHHVNSLDALLNKVIQEQSVADVSLGAFLSGGIDSSLVSAILQSQSNAPIDTFTIGFNNSSFDEARHAAQVSQHIGSNHHELYLTDKAILDVIPKIPYIYDEPFADSSQIPMYLVSQLAKNSVTVSLSGDGGDELFCGYNRYLQAEKYLDHLSRFPRNLKSLISKGILNVSPRNYNRIYSVFNSILGRKGGANTGQKIHKLAKLASYSTYSDAYRFLSSYWNNPARIVTSSEFEPFLQSDLSFEENFINAAMNWDQKWYLPGDNLVKTDRASMSVSLEMRLPLLDAEIIDYAWKIPLSYKIHQGKSKAILREVLYKYVPKSLIERPKMGFSVPISDWINGDLAELSNDLLSKDMLQKSGILNADPIIRVLKSHREGKINAANELWTILMFQLWWTTST